jgi:hypothetical protein
MSPREGFEFAECLFSLDGYIALLIEKKIVAAEGDSPPETHRAGK